MAQSIMSPLNISSLIEAYYVLASPILFLFVSTNSIEISFTNFNYCSVLLKCLGSTEREMKSGNLNHGKVRLVALHLDKLTALVAAMVCLLMEQAIEMHLEPAAVIVRLLTGA